MDEMRNEYQQFRNFTHSQPDHISPGELRSLLEHIGNLYPVQFIVALTLHYNRDSNYTLVDITTTSEKFPGQFARPEPMIRPSNG